MKFCLKTARVVTETLECIQRADSPEQLHQCLIFHLTRVLPADSLPHYKNWQILLDRACAPPVEPPSEEVFSSYPLLKLLWPYITRASTRLNGHRDSVSDFTVSAPGLTPRESEVLRHIALGQTDAIIARALGISTKTASKHVENILRKLRVETRTAAAAYAVRKLPANG